MQVVDEAGHMAGIINTDDGRDDVTTTDRRDPATSDATLTHNVSGAGDWQSSCDWSQPSADDAADACRGVKFFREESSQGIDADDERGDSSSSSDDDWQEVEGLS